MLYYSSSDNRSFFACATKTTSSTKPPVKWEREYKHHARVLENPCSFFFTCNFALVILLQFWLLIKFTRSLPFSHTFTECCSITLTLSSHLSQFPSHYFCPPPTSLRLSFTTRSFLFIFISFILVSFSSSYFCCIYCLIRFFPNAINKLTATQMVKCMFKNANHKRTQISINIQCREGCDEHREPNLRNSKAQLRKRQTSEANSCTMCNISIFIPPLSLCLSIEVVRLECVFVFHWARRGIARARTHTTQHNTIH